MSTESVPYTTVVEITKLCSWSCDNHMIDQKSITRSKMAQPRVFVALFVVLFCHVVVSDHMVKAPRYTVNLDISPEARWNELLHHWNLTEYRELVTKAIE